MCVADEEVLKKLDSGIKKNTALIKKIRLVNEDTREGLLDEMRRTNQSKVGKPNFCGRDEMWS